MGNYRIIDLRSDIIDAGGLVVDGVASPEDAARQALGIEVTRTGPRVDLVARVYWQPIGRPMNMVRLYRKAMSGA